jgi:uncharacterized membrane protein
MSSTSARPAALHLAVYSDHATARRDRDGLAALVDQNAIAADGVVLVTRSAEGKIELEDDAHTARKGTKLGVVGGVVVGVVFPPAVLAAGVAGAAAGAGIGGLLSHGKKRKLTDEIDQALPPGKSGIVALLPEHNEEDAAIAFPQAEYVVSHAVDGESAAKVRAAALGEVESPEGAPRRPHLG